MTIAARKSIDTQSSASISFAPPESSVTLGEGRSEGPRPGVLPNSGDVWNGGPRRNGGRVVQAFPIQRAKVQRPPLRAATLHRQRLVQWLDEHITRRVIFVTAEAGYGKTTLLADWSRTAKARVLWYRIDEDDANWVSFVHYLVAAGRELNQSFAGDIDELLARPVGEVSRNDVVSALVADLGALVTSGPASMVLDDFHLVDHVAEIVDLMKVVINRAPDRLSFILVARRVPTIAVSRLRSMDEVAEMRRDDLRFQLDETGQLFRDTYGRTIDADLLEGVSTRTEGWAASLQLVEAALRGRASMDTRAFVEGLTGATGDLYDYLAEEVVADLEPKIQNFLMQTSILQVVTSESAALVTGLPTSMVEELIKATERLGLLGRRGLRLPEGYRYHPLVREFLEARLVVEFGKSEAVALHRKVANASEGKNWRDAAFHFAAVSAGSDVQRVLVDTASQIMASGEFDVAKSFAIALGPSQAQPVFDLFYCRIDLDKGDHISAYRRARAAYFALKDSPGTLGSLAVANFCSVCLLLGRFDEGRALATELAGIAGADADLGAIARATMLCMDVSIDGNIGEYIAALKQMEADHTRSGQGRYLAVTLVNLGLAYQASGDAVSCLAVSTRAVGLLEAQAAGAELAAGRLAQAWALTHLGRIQDAKLVITSAIEGSTDTALSESLTEAADIAIRYGGEAEAIRLLALARDTRPVSPAMVDVQLLAEGELLLRRGNATEALAKLALHGGPRLSGESGHETRRQALAARIALEEQSPAARETIASALAFAEVQGATFHARCLRILWAAASHPSDLDNHLSLIGSTEPAYMSILAEVLAARLHELTPSTLTIIGTEAALRPDRWRDAFKHVIRPGQPSAGLAAQLLEQVGTEADVAFLRAAAKSIKARGLTPRLGRTLARRVARRVFVEDQGRLKIRIGELFIADDEVRRRVLSVLCFLLTRPALSATRDEVLDAVWPEVDPSSAVNSLNQTLYFLRRVLEPGYVEEQSPKYVHHDSDVIWLDEELIDSRSRLCGRLVNRIGDHRLPEDVQTLAREYRGRFALDFAYEDWASAYRETLHAAYLETVEQAIIVKLNRGEPAHAIGLARRALQIDPSAEQLERLLLRAYHDAGSYAAAGEQYAHYAAFLRNELGLEPPALQALVSGDLTSEIDT